MIISHKHKFIFIATPKTGTTSIESKLKVFNENLNLSDKAEDRGNPTLKHITLEDIKNNCRKNLDDYFSFSFSRNPWCRHLSIFKYYKKMIKFWDENLEKKQKWHTVYESYKNLVGNFEDFNEFVSDNPNFAELQTRWITDNINFVGKMETLQDSFDNICSRIGIQKIELPHLNMSNKIDYKKVYNDKSIDIVSQAYKKDIDYLKYNYEN